jgi:uncharacterized protein YabE (DUF348 family)
VKKAQDVMTGSRFFSALLSKRLLVIVAICVVFFAMAILTGRVRADDSPRPEGSRLITLYDHGTERSFITTASTVEGALAEAGIEVDVRDRVEPSLKEELVADGSPSG